MRDEFNKQDLEDILEGLNLEEGYEEEFNADELSDEELEELEDTIDEALSIVESDELDDESDDRVEVVLGEDDFDDESIMEARRSDVKRLGTLRSYLMSIKDYLMDESNQEYAAAIRTTSNQLGALKNKYMKNKKLGSLGLFTQVSKKGLDEDTLLKMKAQKYSGWVEYLKAKAPLVKKLANLKADKYKNLQKLVGLSSSKIILEGRGAKIGNKNSIYGRFENPTPKAPLISDIFTKNKDNRVAFFKEVVDQFRAYGEELSAFYLDLAKKIQTVLGTDSKREAKNAKARYDRKEKKEDAPKISKNKKKMSEILENEDWN